MTANKAQEDYWASPAALKWIEHEQALDTAMAGMLDVVLDAARIEEGDRVLDVGCGTGASTLATARRASHGHVVGNDISRPLLDRARSRASAEGVTNTSFLRADAQSHPFEQHAFDVLVSRIGMSFFSDSVAAFENLSNALKPHGRMAFVGWAAVDRNPWFYIPKKAAEARLGELPKGDPRAPGPTAFQDIDYVVALMSRAGLASIEAKPVEVFLTPPGGAPGGARAASRVGPAARIMKAHQGDAADEAGIEAAVREAFLRYEENGEARVPALVNLFTCTT